MDDNAFHGEPENSMVSSATTPTTQSLLEKSRLTTEDWYKSKRTTKQYASYVKAGKKWLEEWVQEELGENEGKYYLS